MKFLIFLIFCNTNVDALKKPNKKQVVYLMAAATVLVGGYFLFIKRDKKIKIHLIDKLPYKQFSYV